MIAEIGRYLKLNIEECHALTQKLNFPLKSILFLGQKLRRWVYFSSCSFPLRLVQLSLFDTPLARIYQLALNFHQILSAALDRSTVYI